MIRYDQKDVKQESKEDNSVPREHVTIDAEHMIKIKNLFIDELMTQKINGVSIIRSINNSIIICNADITVKMISDSLGKNVESKLEFIKDLYMYRMDNYTDAAYGRPVTAIQERPYSFQVGKNPDIIEYEFIT